MSIQHLAKLSSCILLLALLKAAAQPARTNALQTPSDQTKIELRGEVVDHAGALVPDFRVEIRTVIGAAPTEVKASPHLSIRANSEGSFLANLPPGAYEVCPARCPQSCRTVQVQSSKAPEYIQLKVDYYRCDHVTSEEFDSRVRETAGPGALDCGRVQPKDSPKPATRCVLHAYRNHKAFYARYDGKGIRDSEGAYALAGDSIGKVYSLGFDSMGIEPSITTCSQPVRLRVTRTGGEVVCFAGGRWLGDK